MTRHEGTVAGESTRRAGAARAGRSARIAVAATAVLATGVLLAGCNDDGSGGANAAGHQKAGGAAPVGQSTSAGHTSESSTGDTGSSGQAGTGGSSSTRRVGRCHTSDLDASVSQELAEVGRLNFTVSLTNHSRSTCTVHGYPGLAFFNSRGEHVSVDPHRVTGKALTARLSYDQSALATLSFADPDTTGVRTVTPTKMKITPPDEWTSLTVKWFGGSVTRSGQASVPKIRTFRPSSHY